MRTILVTAYAINPYKGSEDGTGWNWVLQEASAHKVIAITRKNNQEAIDKYISENTDVRFDNLSFEYYDLPYWMRFWKKGEKAALIYYYLWQLFLPFFIWINKLNYDYVHHLNFHNDWTPSFLWLQSKPFIWGPIGHHPLIPKALHNPDYPESYYRDNANRWKIKKLFWRFDPFLKITKRTAAHILVMHESVAENLNLENHKYTVCPAIASEKTEIFQYEADESFDVISIGRFIPLKGFDITIKAFTQFYKGLPDYGKSKAKLHIIGKGKLKNDLNNLIKTLKMESAIQIYEWMPRSELNSLYQKSSCFFFPSHEGAGMVSLEALSYGLPLLCFDNIGPGAFIDDKSGVKVPYKDYHRNVSDFALQLRVWFENPRELSRHSIGARRLFAEKYQWSRKSEVINQIISKLDEEYASSSLHTSL